MDSALLILLEFVIILLAVLVTITIIQKPKPEKKENKEEQPVYIPVPEKDTTSPEQFKEEQTKAVQDVARSLQIWNDVYDNEDK